MRLPGPLEWFSLAGSVALASAPTAMGVLSLADGDVWIGSVYLAIGVVMFVLPEYVVRQLPGPRDVVERYRPRPIRAIKRKLPGGERSEDE